MESLCLLHCTVVDCTLFDCSAQHYVALHYASLDSADGMLEDKMLLGSVASKERQVLHLSGSQSVKVATAPAMS